MANNEYDSSLSLRLQMKNAREQGLTCMRKIRYSQTQNSRLSKAKSPDSKSTQEIGYMTFSEGITL